MSTLNSVRHVVQAALAVELEANTVELAGVKVMDGVNPRDFETETIAIGDVSSVEGGILHIQTGRKQRKDQFTFDVGIWAYKSGQTPAEAKARAAVMLSVLDDILADDATFQGLQWIQIMGYDGPNAEPTNEGFSAYITVRVECQSQLI